MARYRERREQLRYTQVEIAQRAGVSREMLVRYEAGKAEPGAGVLVALAFALECSTDYLLGVAPSPVPEYLPDGMSAVERTVIEGMRARDVAVVLQALSAWWEG